MPDSGDAAVDGKFENDAGSECVENSSSYHCSVVSVTELQIFMNNNKFIL